MIYRKRGVTERWESGTLLEVRESGIAIEGEVFQCYPEGTPSGLQARGGLPGVARQFEEVIPSGVSVERLILTQGVAEHEYEGRVWREESVRVHLSLTRARVRALLDLASFDCAQAASIAEALTRLTAERPAPASLRLAPNVTAAILPLLAGAAPPNVRVVQTAWGIDGRGNPVAEATGDWPNWYRPSYRLRPVRMPLHLRIECDEEEIDLQRPVAVALLAPASSLTVRVLVDDGKDVYPATVRVSRIASVAAGRTWYPYGGGSFGAEMML